MTAGSLLALRFDLLFILRTLIGGGVLPAFALCLVLRGGVFDHKVLK